MKNTPAESLSENALSDLYQGAKLLTHHGIKRFVVIPLLINIVVFSAVIWFTWGQYEVLLTTYLPEDAWWSFMRWLLWPVFVASLLLVSVFTFTPIANIIASPFNSMLAARIEMLLCGHLPPDDDTPLFKSILPIVGTELKKQWYYIIRAIPLLLLLLIPVVNLAAPFLWFLFSAWFLSFEYGDYPMGNNQLSFKQQKALLKKNRVRSITFGGLVTLISSIPIINFISMPVGVAGATVYWHKKLHKCSQEIESMPL